jgi:uncharacterized membrane protein
MTMNEDQIVARARQEVAERQALSTTQRWNGLWRWLLPTLILALLIVFLVAPGSLPRKLLLAMGGVCGLRPAHSYFVGGIQLPLEARMTGIYGGALITLVMLLALGRLGARRLGGTWVLGILMLFFLSMAGDGINSTLTDLGLPHPYESTNLTRLVTGLFAGVAIAPVLVWLLGVVMTPRDPEPRRAVIRAPCDLAALLALNAGFAALVLDGRAAFYYPVALISVAGVVAVLASVTFMGIVAIGGLAGQMMQLRQRIIPGALAVLITFAVLAMTAAARWIVIAGA